MLVSISDTSIWQGSLNNIGNNIMQKSITTTTSFTSDWGKQSSTTIRHMDQQEILEKCNKSTIIGYLESLQRQNEIIKEEIVELKYNISDRDDHIDRLQKENEYLKGEQDNEVLFEGTLDEMVSKLEEEKENHDLTQEREIELKYVREELQDENTELKRKLQLCVNCLKPFVEVK